MSVLVFTPPIPGKMDEEDDIFGEEYFPLDPDEVILDEDLPDEMDVGVGPEPVASQPMKQPVAPPQVSQPDQMETPESSVPIPAPEVQNRLAEDVVPASEPPSESVMFYPIASASGDRVYLKQRNVDLPPINGGTFLEKPLEELHAISLELQAQRDADAMHWMTVTAARVCEDARQFVDKYKPTRFVDLLSDDAVNKQMMTWLNEWRKNIAVPFAGVTISPPPPGAADPNVPPPVLNKKVILIGGPPGVGKSALIDVCCRHFKYQLIESSASDERGRAAMHKVITDVCGNRSVLDASRPQALLIEEVDGDECTAADVIVDILHKHPETIKRPIICVCTDVYKKNLRSLREAATVIQMSQPRQLRLAEKIKQICELEGVKIESLAVDRLISLCERDIRSVLNQLEALASRVVPETSTTPHTPQKGKAVAKTLRVADIMKYVAYGASNSVDAAVKDNQRSEMELMQLLFEPKRSRPKSYTDQVTAAIAGARSLPASLAEIFAHCTATVPFSDVNLRHTNRISELMSLNDVGLLSRSLALPMRYASHWCAAVGKPRIDLVTARRLVALRYVTRSDRETVTSALVKGSLHSVSASRAIMWNRSAWTLTTARLLIVALTPEQNPVWTKKMTNHVHPEMIRVAKLYADFGIELIEDASQPGVYAMNPNVRMLSELEGVKSQVPSFAVGSAMGELLRSQVTVELAKAHNDGSAELVAKGKRTFSTGVDVALEESLSKKQRMHVSLAAWRVAQPEKTAGVVVKKFPFEFRFNEGHTNAVKRVMHLKDFLPHRVRD